MLPTSEPDSPYEIGERVFFWTGRGSEGFGTIRELKNGRAFIDPEPEARRGSDYRELKADGQSRNRWAPRDYGVRLTQLNSSPRA
ncbi:hypothetical protein GGR40_001027 [Novosphingobium gossypii]